MSDLIVNFTDTTLHDGLNQASQPVLLDLWAPWCGPCLAMAPLLEKVAAATAGQLTVAKLNVEEYEHLMPRFRVRSIPTLLLFRNGSEVARKVGVESLSDLNSWLRAQGITIEAEGEVTLPVAQPWPSFYGDDALMGFLTGRLREKALAGEISHYNFPRPEYLLTAPYVLAGQESLEVFERVTGLPSVLALWLEYLDYVTPQQIEELTDALASGKDYGMVPLRLVTHWLSEDSLAWQNLLAPDIEGLRQQWLTLTHSYLNTQATPRQSWLTLQQQASNHYHQCQEDRAFEQNLCALISILSPPSALQDEQASSAVIHHWYECQEQLEKIKAGWSRGDLKMAARRWAWIEPQLTEDTPEEDVEDKIAVLREQWKLQAAEFATFAVKEQAFYVDFATRVPQLSQPFQAPFLQLLKQAPDAL